MLFRPCFRMWKSFSKKLEGFAPFCLFLWPLMSGANYFETDLKFETFGRKNYLRNLRDGE